MTSRLCITLLSACLLGVSSIPADAAPTQERTRRSSPVGGTETDASTDESLVVGAPARESADSGAEIRKEAPRQTEEAQPELTNQDAVRFALKSVQSDGLQAVLRGGQPIHIFYDFDGDSRDDLCMLTVAQEQENLIERLSDFSRLFRADAHPVDLNLRIFLRRGESLVLLSDVALGRKYVVDSLRKVALHRSASLPVAVAAVCLTVQGSEQEWVVFPESGRPSQFSIQESPAIRTTMEDIDSDGYLDVIKEVKAIEEGTGYETFLTWFRWNGHEYSEFRSTNVVRNLRAFLDRGRELLTSADAADFLSFGIDREILAGLRRRGFDDREIFSMIFHQDPAAGGDPASGSDPASGGIRFPERISGIVFPQIMENPFVRIANHYYLFPVSVRIDGSDGDGGIYHAEIVMSSNPFRDRQFSFLPRNE